MKPRPAEHSQVHPAGCHLSAELIFSGPRPHCESLAQPGCSCLLSGLSLVPLLGQVALFTKAVLLSLAAHESPGGFRNYTCLCPTPRGSGLRGQGCSLGFGNF